jgi:hypothetical protein
MLDKVLTRTSLLRAIGLLGAILRAIAGAGGADPAAAIVGAVVG